MRRNVESAPKASPVDAHERTRDYLSEEEFAVLLQGTPAFALPMAQCGHAHAHLLSWVTRHRTLPPQAPGRRPHPRAHLDSASQREPVDRATAPSRGTADAQTLLDAAWQCPTALALSQRARRS